MSSGENLTLLPLFKISPFSDFANTSNYLGHTKSEGPFLFEEKSLSFLFMHCIIIEVYWLWGKSALQMKSFCESISI